MHRFLSLSLVLSAAFSSLLSAPCVGAQPVNQTATIASIDATTQACYSLRDVCSGINLTNVHTEGEKLDGGLFAILFAIHEGATGLESADPGHFENLPLVLATFVQLEGAMKALLAAITAKSTVLIHGGYRDALYLDLINMVAIVDALADELANRGTDQFKLSFYAVKASLDLYLEKIIAPFSSGGDGS